MQTPKNTLLVIPGFGESADKKPYSTIMKKYQNVFEILPYTPIWNYRTASDWLKDLSNVLEKLDTKNTIVFAFSLGAYLTLLQAENYPFKKIILCSLSPFYKEQLHLMPEIAKKYLGKRRITDFASHHIPRTIKSPAVFLFGSDDWIVGIDEAKKMSEEYQVTFELIPNTPHELTDKYLERVYFHIEVK